MEFDVTIVGAGVAGLYAAREFSKNNLKTIIIDSSKHPGEPNFSTAGIPIDTIAEFNLSKEGISESITKLLCATFSSEFAWSYSEPIAYTLDFRKTKLILAEEALNEGCRVEWDVKGEDLLYENNEIIGVKTSIGDIKSKYIVDASGTSGTLMVKAGLRAQSPCYPSTGIEVIVRDKTGHLEQYKKSFSLYFDTKIIPHGYAWVFSHGTDLYKIGVCEYNEKPSRDLPRLEERLNMFIDKVADRGAIETIEEHGHSIFITNKIKNVRKGNLLGIGDAVGTINPFFGEGIRHSLYSAKFAVEAITKNHRENKNLSQYEEQLREYQGFRWKLASFAAKGLYKKNSSRTQALYEELVKFGVCLDNEGVLGLSFMFSPLPIVKAFPNNITLMARLLLAMI